MGTYFTVSDVTELVVIQLNYSVAFKIALIHASHVIIADHDAALMTLLPVGHDEPESDLILLVSRHLFVGQHLQHRPLHPFTAQDATNSILSQ